MFYTENLIQKYPNKRILEDVMSRGSNSSNGYVFSPYPGMRETVEKKLNESTGRYFDPKEIINAWMPDGDFRPEKARANDDGADRDDKASDITDYYIDLENVDESFVRKLVESILYNFRFNKNCNGVAYETKSYDGYVDDETGEILNPTDLEVIKHEYSVDEINEACDKLAYLLKQLHQGSVEWGVSLLSFIIAKQKLLESGEAIKWISLVKTGVYTMRSDGFIGRQLVQTDEKDTDGYRRALDWIRGDIPNDIYYKAYIELLQVTRILDIDLTLEDAREYQVDFMRDVVCTYVESNKEYLSTYGMVDTNVLRCLTPEGLTSLINNIDEVDSEDLSAKGVIYDIELVAANLYQFEVKAETGWEPNFSKVKKIISALYKDNKETCSKWLQTFRSENGAIRSLGSQYIVKQVKGVNYFLTPSGRFASAKIFDEAQSFFIKYIEPEDILRDVKGVTYELHRQSF